MRNRFHLDIVYGDTDSIMIDVKTHDIKEALFKGTQIKKEINKQYKMLEIEMDGVFKPLLLLKKKKYASLKVDNFEELLRNPNTAPVYKQEIKGLDMVRRDWCGLSKKVSEFALGKILSGKPTDEVIEDIQDYLSQVSSWFEEKTIGVQDLVITKQLSKLPVKESSSDLPHVHVARRLVQHGQHESTLVGHFIHYLICSDSSLTQ